MAKEINDETGVGLDMSYMFHDKIVDAISLLLSGKAGDAHKILIVVEDFMRVMKEEHAAAIEDALAGPVIVESVMIKHHGFKDVEAANYAN